MFMGGVGQLGKQSLSLFTTLCLPLSNRGLAIQVFGGHFAQAFVFARAMAIQWALYLVSSRAIARYASS
jgi:hypothetical protein